MILWQDDPPPRYVPVSLSRVKQAIHVRRGGHDWCLQIIEPTKANPGNYDMGMTVVLRRDGHFLRRVYPCAGPFAELVPVKIGAGYPVFAARGAFGLGEHWDTIFFGVRDHDIVEMGHAPAQNSHGPVLWHHHRDLWLFDNWDRYEARDNPKFKPTLMIMRVSRAGHFKLWRKITVTESTVPTTVHTPDFEES